jgi:hypothetical protein
MAKSRSNRSSRRGGDDAPPGEDARPGAAEVPSGDGAEPGAAADERQPTVDVRIRGTARGARRAIRSLAGGGGGQGNGGGAAPGDPEPEPEVDEEGQRLMELLADPQNIVTIRRIKPRKWGNLTIAGPVMKVECPTTYDDLCADVFEECGGGSYKAIIHPNTPTGMSKMHGAFAFENPDPVFPAKDGEPYPTPDDADPSVDPEAMGLGGDPTLERVDDPMAEARRTMRDSQALLAQRIAMKTQRATLRDLGEDLGESGTGPSKDAQRVTELEKKLEEERHQRELAARDQRMDKLEGMVEKVLEKLANPAAPAPTPGIDLTTKLLEMSNTHNKEMLQLMEKMAKAQPSLDGDIERMKKLREALGLNTTEGEGRGTTLSRKFESMAYDLLLSRITGTDTSPSIEEDPLKYAVSQLAPILKTYVEKKMDNDEKAKGAPLSDEEKAKIYKQAAGDVARQLVAEGKIFPIDPATGKLMVPVAAKPGAAPPVPAPAPAAKAPKPTEDNVAMPPGPASKAYDRTKAVNFVLDTIIADIPRGCPENTYAIGDCLDRLDPELLDKLMIVNNGAELEELLKPWADPARIARIKEAGKDPLVKSWLNRVIVTVQNEYTKAVKAAAELTK